MFRKSSRSIDRSPIRASQKSPSKVEKRGNGKFNGADHVYDEDMVVHSWRRYLSPSKRNPTQVTIPSSKPNRSIDFSSSDSPIARNCPPLPYSSRSSPTRSEARIEDNVTMIVNRNLMTQAFRSWKQYWLAASYFTRRSYLIVFKILIKMRMTGNHRQRINRGVSEVYRHSALLRGVKALEKHVALHNLRIQLMHQGRNVEKMMDMRLTRRSWSCWIHVIDHVVNRKRIDIESLERKSKIKAFVHRIQEAPIIKPPLPMEPPKKSSAVLRVDAKVVKKQLSMHQPTMKPAAAQLVKTSHTHVAKMDSFHDSDSDLDLSTIMNNLHNLDINLIHSHPQLPDTRHTRSYSRSPPYRSASRDIDVPFLDMLSLNDKQHEHNMKESSSSRPPSSSRSSTQHASARKSPTKPLSRVASSRSILVEAVASRNPVRSSSRSSRTSSPSKPPTITATTAVATSKRSASAIKATKPSALPLKPPVDFNTRAQHRRDRITQLQKDSQLRHKQQQQTELLEARLKDEQDAKAMHELREKKRFDMEKQKSTSVYHKAKQLEDNHLQQRAINHRYKQLLISYGWAPWMRYIDRARQYWQQACEFYDKKIRERCFLRWNAYLAAIRYERYRREQRLTLQALQHYRSSLLRITWRLWRCLRKIHRAKAVTIHTRFSGFSRIRRSWKAWKIAIERCKRMEAYKLSLAAPHGRIVTLKHCWRLWMNYLQEAKLQHEVRYRSAATWSKVQSWLQTS